MTKLTGQQSETEYNSNIEWEPWIQTVSGGKFHYLSGPCTEVVPEDICVVIPRIARWAGHTDKFYSVGQHCVLTRLLVQERGGTPEQQLVALIHDAPEVYMCDLPSPLKRLNPRFKEIENKVWAKISKRFFGKSRLVDPLVKECDSVLLVTEARDLFPFKPIDNWVDKLPPAWDKHIEPVGPTAGYNLYKKHLEELFNE